MTLPCTIHDLWISQTGEWAERLCCRWWCATVWGQSNKILLFKLCVESFYTITSYLRGKLGSFELFQCPGDVHLNTGGVFQEAGFLLYMYQENLGVIPGTGSKIYSLLRFYSLSVRCWSAVIQQTYSVSCTDVAAAGSNKSFKKWLQTDMPNICWFLPLKRVFFSCFALLNIFGLCVVDRMKLDVHS